MFKPYVHESNTEVFNAINKLRDEKNKCPWNTVTMEMIKCIARFNRDKGCFMGLERMCLEIGSKVSLRTLKRHDRYLTGIGLIVKERRQKRGKTFCIRRLKMPTTPIIPSLCKFSHDTGIYSQTLDNKDVIQTEDDSLFCTPLDILSPHRGTECPKAGGQNDTLSKNVLKRMKKETTTKVSFCESELEKNPADVQSFSRLPSAACGGGMRRPRREGLRPHRFETENFNETERPMIDTENEEMVTKEKITSEIGDVILPGFDEPVIKNHVYVEPSVLKPMIQTQDPVPEPPAPKEAIPANRAKKNKPRNKKERRAEAIKKHNQGHVVNPTGGPDIRLRKFDWKRARDIAPEGSITVAQLWRHIHLKYEESFGEGLLEGQMPQDRYAIGAWFDKLKQRFMKTCGYQIDNRDLSEYFTWILDPKRLESMMGMGRLTASKNFLRVEQIQGAVYVQRFYNEVLRRRTGTVIDTANENIKRLHRISDEVHDAFDYMTESGDSTMGWILSLVQYGFPLVLQFMMERQSMSEGQARKRIIDIMAEFIGKATEVGLATKYLDKAADATKRKAETYNKYTVWQDWETKCNGLIEEATEKAKSEKAKNKT